MPGRGSNGAGQTMAPGMTISLTTRVNHSESLRKRSSNQFRQGPVTEIRGCVLGAGRALRARRGAGTEPNGLEVVRCRGLGAVQ